MALPTVDDLPEPPQRLVDEKDAFVTKGDAWNLALYTWSYQVQALIAAIAAAYTADNYNSTSTTSLAIGVGTKVLTVQTDKIYRQGQFVIAASSADVSNYMYCQVSAYNPANGQLTLNAIDYGGSGTKTDWVISLTAPRKTTPIALVLAAAESSTSTTPALIADTNGNWSIGVTNGQRYRVRIIGTFQTAATTTGGRLSVVAASGAAGTINGFFSAASAQTLATSQVEQTIAALPADLVLTGVGTINTPHHIICEFVFVCTAGGTLELRWGSEVNASAAQLNAGSVMIYEAI